VASPEVYILNTTKAEVQGVLRSTRELAERADARVIIVVSFPPALRAEVSERSTLRVWLSRMHLLRAVHPCGAAAF